MSTAATASTSSARRSASTARTCGHPRRTVVSSAMNSSDQTTRWATISSPDAGSSNGK
jgi:hypothetical protein